MEIKENYSLKKHNTFGLDVKARHFAEYYSVDELKEILASDIARNNKLLSIGMGSNLLFTGDFEGLVLHSKIKFIEKVAEDDDFVKYRVGAGVPWDYFCNYMAMLDYSGAENLSLIPGEVGAAAVQNIGAYGVEVCDLIDSVETLELDTLKEKTFNVDDCRYGYRESIFKSDLKGKYIVTFVNFLLKKNPSFNLEYGSLKDLASSPEDLTVSKVRDAVIAIRKDKLPDPENIGNVGSFFKNPVVDTATFNALLEAYPKMPYYVVEEDKQYKIPAGWLIEQSGWKGKEMGGAAVYEKQSLVLINKNNATANDIIDLAAAISASVKEKYGIDISPEVNYI